MKNKQIRRVIEQDGRIAAIKLLRALGMEFEEAKSKVDDLIANQWRVNAWG